MSFTKSDSKSSSIQNTGIEHGAHKTDLSAFAGPESRTLARAGMDQLFAPIPQFNPGKFGVAAEFDPAIETLGNNMFGKASSTAGARGFLSPENLGGVIGSAVRQAAPQMAQYADSAANRKLFGPDQIMAQRYGNVTNIFDVIARLLGGSGSSMSSSNSLGFAMPGGAMGSPSGGGGGGGGPKAAA
jgi:hypothetical protein